MPSTGDQKLGGRTGSAAPRPSHRERPAAAKTPRGRWSPRLDVLLDLVFVRVDPPRAGLEAATGDELGAAACVVHGVVRDAVVGSSGLP